jgi:membrane associated rhomboid family serine protease
MGIYDRDYVRERPRGGFGDFSVASITTWLIVINVAAFFADGILLRMTVAPPPQDLARWEDEGVSAEDAAAYYYQTATGPLTRWGYFSTDKALRHGQIWRVVTFQFLHAGAGHLLMNMLGLFFFGPIVEGHFGPRRYLAFYLLCGLAGAASYAALSALRVIVQNPATPLVGASAGVFGLLVAAAIIAPDVQVFYYLVPVTIRMLALLSMGLAAYAVLATGYNAGGQAAHLGGGVLGFGLMKNQHWLNFVAPSGRVSTVRPSVPGVRRGRRSAFQKDWSKDLNR